jgi:hypothetical protein
MAASDGNGASRESAGAGLHRRVLDVRSRAASTVDSGSGGHGWRPRRSTGLGPQGRGELRAHRQVGLEAKHEREPWLSAMGALGPGPRRGGSLAGSWSPGRRGAKSSWSRRRVWRWAGWRSPKARTRCMPLGGTCCRNRRSISSAGSPSEWEAMARPGGLVERARETDRGRACRGRGRVRQIAASSSGAGARCARRGRGPRRARACGRGGATPACASRCGGRRGRRTCRGVRVRTKSLSSQPAKPIRRWARHGATGTREVGGLGPALSAAAVENSPPA